MILMKIFLTSVHWKSKFLPPFCSCPSDIGSVAGKIGCDVWHVNMSCAQLFGWIWIRDSDAQCRIIEQVDFHPDQFCCWITQQRDSGPMEYFPALKYLHIVCVFAFDQCLHLSLHRLYQKLCSWESAVHCHSFGLLVILTYFAKMTPTSSRS